MKRVLVFGTFDVLHPGHLHFLRSAKKLGDYLIVSLARDENVIKVKGRRASNSEKDRTELISALKIVNMAVLGSTKDYITHIISQKPHIIALGYDQRAYTQGLKSKLAESGLKRVKIVRLKPYKKNLYKSSKFLI